MTDIAKELPIELIRVRAVLCIKYKSKNKDDYKEIEELLQKVDIAMLSGNATNMTILYRELCNVGGQHE